MKNKAMSKILSLLLTAALLLGVFGAPTAAHAVELVNGVPALTVNTASATTVGFGGRQWVVIGYDGSPLGSGYNTPTNTLLLLLEGTEAVTTTVFHGSSNEYGNSTLKSVMDGQHNALGREQALVTARTLAGYGTYPDADKIADTSDVTTGFWPLSVNEAKALDSTLRNTGYS